VAIVSYLEDIAERLARDIESLQGHVQKFRSPEELIRQESHLRKRLSALSEQVSGLHDAIKTLCTDISKPSVAGSLVNIEASINSLARLFCLSTENEQLKYQIRQDKIRYEKIMNNKMREHEAQVYSLGSKLAALSENNKVLQEQTKGRDRELKRLRAALEEYRKFNKTLTEKIKYKNNS
jgi:chromosome segregation ATPase